MLKKLWVIFKKETSDNLRDRKTVWNSLVGVMLNPILYLLIFGLMNSTVTEQVEQVLQLPIVGAEHAPNLVIYLDRNNVDILPPPDDLERALREGKFDVVLVIPPEYSEDFESGSPASIRIYQDQSEQRAGIAASRLRGLLRNYNAQIAAMRLIARGVDPALLKVLSVEDVNISQAAQQEGGYILGLLPVIMLTAVFLGGFYLAVDMMAGERERESLEPLLANPVRREILLLGKYLAALVYTIFATFLATGLFVVLFKVPVLQEFTSIRINIELSIIGRAVLLMLPVVFMAVALQMMISTYARNVKEAQTYTQILSMVGFLPALLLSVLPVRQAPWMAYVPTISQFYLVSQMARGEALTAAVISASAGVTLLVALAALLVIRRRFNQEQIIFKE